MSDLSITIEFDSREDPESVAAGALEAIRAAIAEVAPTRRWTPEGWVSLS